MKREDVIKCCMDRGLRVGNVYRREGKIITERQDSRQIPPLYEYEVMGLYPNGIHFLVTGIPKKGTDIGSWDMFNIGTFSVFTTYFDFYSDNKFILVD